MKRLAVLAGIVLGVVLFAGAQRAHAQQLGSITVCKVILDSAGNVVDGSAKPGDMFEIAHEWPTSPTVFTAPLTLNTDLLGGVGDDAECVTYDDLALDEYTYDAESITGSGYFPPKYNDQYDTAVVDLADFFEYEFGGVNLNSDGYIILNEERPDRTLVILNQYSDHDCSNDGDIVVKNYNEAFVVNVVVSGANTGGNSTGGSSGGNGGNGGKIRNYGDGDVDDSTTGNGGNGGNGGVGGTSYTGDATSSAGLVNTTNENVTRISRCCPCGCNHDGNGGGDGDDTVENSNGALVINGGGAGANTGGNGTSGSDGSEGGNGGKIKNGPGEGDVKDSTTGSGGTGGSGSPGGFSNTGHSSSSAGTVNVVNRNLTEIRR